MMISSRYRLVPFFYGIFTIAIGVVVLLIARHDRMTFPNPWNDEARFYLPSWNFSRSGSLSPQILNAPDGIYWVPDGFYIWMGTLLAVFGRSIYTAQLMCELSLAFAVSILARAFLTITESATMASIFSLILISPPIIFAANMVRMEAPLCLLFAMTVWLHIHRAYLAAVSLFLLSLTIHPAFIFAFVAYAGVLSVMNFHRPEMWRRSWQTVAERAILLLVLLALFVETSRIILHFHLFIQHMHYQALRKLSSTRWKVFIRPQAILFYLEIGVILIGLRLYTQKILAISERRLILPLIAATLGMQAYAFLGGEAVYDVYSLSIGPAIFLCLIYRFTTLFGSTRITPI